MIKPPPLAYIAGPYRAATPWLVEQNIREAEAVAYRVAQRGAYPVCPHTNTRQIFESAQSDPQFWLDGTLELMRASHAIVLTRRWCDSSGARAERAEAERMRMPIFGESHLDNGEFAAWVRLWKSRP